MIHVTQGGTPASFGGDPTFYNLCRTVRYTAAALLDNAAAVNRSRTYKNTRDAELEFLDELPTPLAAPAGAEPAAQLKFITHQRTHFSTHTVPRTVGRFDVLY